MTASEQGTQQKVIIEIGRKGGYVPITSAGGPPPGDQALADHPQTAPRKSKAQSQPQAPTPQQNAG
jgi:hypothetical protein